MSFIDREKKMTKRRMYHLDGEKHEENYCLGVMDGGVKSTF